MKRKADRVAPPVDLKLSDHAKWEKAQKHLDDARTALTEATDPTISNISATGALHEASQQARFASITLEQLAGSLYATQAA